MPLRTICDYYGRSEVESWFQQYNLNEYLTEEQQTILDAANIFSKTKLAQMIVDNYYMREIGFETPALFKHNVLSRMDQIMQKYGLLIYSAALKYDPLINESYTETFNRDITGKQSGSNNIENKQNGDYSTTSTDDRTITDNGSGLNIHSDTPQGEINKSNILDGTYATDTQAFENSNTQTNNNTNTTTQNQDISNTTTQTQDQQNNTLENFIRKVEGNRGINITMQKLIMDYRETIDPYYQQIINELNDLFMLIY